MSLARLHMPALANGEKIHLTDLIGVGGGRAFWVKLASSTGYKAFFNDHNVKQDGVNSVYNTVQDAIDACVPNRGDVIYLAPGFTEAVTSSSFAFDAAGVTIIGLGTGSNKATLTFAATDSRINVTAANGRFQNIRIQAAVGDVVTAFLHATAAQNTEYVDVEFFATSTFNFINCYTLGAANISDGCKWERNYLRTEDTGQLALCITGAAQNDLKFYDNYVIHAAAAAALLTAGSSNLLGLDVVGNTVETAQSDGAVGVLVITTSTASTGSIRENHMKTSDAAANVAIPIASLVYAANNYIDGNDEVGTIVAVGTLFNNA